MSRNTLESHQTCGQTGEQTGQWNADLAEHMSRLRSPMPPGTIILGIYSSRLGSFVSICRSNQGAARMTAITRRTREKLEKLIEETDHRDAEITVIYADAWIDLLHTALRGMIAAHPGLGRLGSNHGKARPAREHPVRPDGRPGHRNQLERRQGLAVA